MYCFTSHAIMMYRVGAVWLVARVLRNLKKFICYVCPWASLAGNWCLGPHPHWLLMLFSVASI
jgi:hypothetical protein